MSQLTEVLHHIIIYPIPIPSYCSMVTDCLTTPVQSKLDTWRKRVTVLDKVTTARH